jgi:hypothetical protein
MRPSHTLFMLKSFISFVYAKFSQPTWIAGNVSVTRTFDKKSVLTIENSSFSIQIKFVFLLSSHLGSHTERG